MALLDAEKELDAGKGTAAPGTAAPGTTAPGTAAPSTAAWYRSRLVLGIPGELVTLLAILATAVFMSSRLDAWGEQGLDFSVYWHGGKILNEAGQSPSDLYSRTVGWAGGPELPFTYPPFAALLFGLLARLPEESALMLFNAAGAAVAVWVAVRGVRYWSAKQDWRSTFGGAGFKATRNRWGAVILLLAVINLGPWRETQTGRPTSMLSVVDMV
jgi:alpha-1,2-mannosyltransferase